MTVQARIRESSNPASTKAAIRFSIWTRSSNGLSLGFQRNRRDVVLPVGCIRLRIDRDVPVAVSKDVVVVKVAVDEPLIGVADLREHLVCQRHQLAATLGGTVEPAANLGDDRSKGGLRAPPQFARDRSRHRDRVRFRHRRQVVAGNRPLLQNGPTVAPTQANGPVTVPQRERLRFVQRLIVAVPRHLDNELTGGCDVGDGRERERRPELKAPMPRRIYSRQVGRSQIEPRRHTSSLRGTRVCQRPSARPVATLYVLRP